MRTIENFIYIDLNGESSENLMGWKNRYTLMGIQL